MHKLDIKEKHGGFDMTDVVAVIKTEQWYDLCRIARGNDKIKSFMLDILGNDDIFNGNTEGIC